MRGQEGVPNQGLLEFLRNGPPRPETVAIRISRSSGTVLVMNALFLQGLGATTSSREPGEGFVAGGKQPPGKKARKVGFFEPKDGQYRLPQRSQSPQRDTSTFSGHFRLGGRA